MPQSLASCFIVLVAALLAVGTPGAQAPSGAAAQRPVDFAAEVKPMLEAKCLGCHGEKLKLSKLDLRTRESAIDGGAHGPSLVPGNAEQSRMYRHVAGLEAPAMPMRGEALSATEIDALKRWIDQGARWDAAVAMATPPAAPTAVIEERPITAEERAYWAFVPPVKAPLPDPTRPGVTHPIDRFLEQARAARGLVAAPRADARTLVRRAYLDLLGLPPSPEEVDAFRRRYPARRLGTPDRLAAGVAALRRALRPALARRGPLRRLRRLRVRRPPPQRLALSRLRHQGFQRRQALRPVPGRADRRRRDGRQDARQRRSRPGSCAPGRGCCSARRTTPSAASTTSTTCSGRSARARSA